MNKEVNVMRAVVCDGVGEAQVMHLAEVPMPEPLNDVAAQVLVRVRAAGLNRPDLLQRAGLYAPPADASPYLGLEVAGEIVAVQGSTDDLGVAWVVGDAVCALTHGGGYAEFVWVDARHCLPIPNNWSLVEAASIPETFFTVWLNVFVQAHLGADARGQSVGAQTLLVHAGASGIGVAAIQIAKALGHRVLVTLRQMAKADACRALGADEVLLLDEQWAAQVQSATQKQGVHVVLDMLGTATAAGNMQALAVGGRIAWIAFLTGSKMELKVHEIMGKQAKLSGAFLRPQSAQTKAQIALELRELVIPLINEGKIVPAVDKVFSMADVVQAHEYMASNQHTGKIVLTWD